jgi:hypothetical protein
LPTDEIELSVTEGDGVGVGEGGGGGGGGGVLFGVEIGLGRGLPDVPAVGVGLAPGVLLGVGLAPGVTPGVVPGVGEANGPPGSITCSATELRHLDAQQIVTVWSPAPILRGTRMGTLTCPLESAWKVKMCRVLRSWISPF